MYSMSCYVTQQILERLVEVVLSVEFLSVWSLTHELMICFEFHSAVFITHTQLLLAHVF